MIALTRPVTDAIVSCELTHLARAPINVARARAQHADYERCLASLGCRIVRLEADPAMADAVFVEDAAVVFDELAVIARPGAQSRRAETAGVATALASHRPLVHITAPGTLDGGDVLVIQHDVFVGISTRTNAAGIDQLRDAVRPHGYAVHAVPVRCLHLKTAVTAIGSETLLLDRAWVDGGPFSRYTIVEVDPSETYAANALIVGGVVLYSEAFPRTRQRMAARGIDVRSVAADELAKAEGGVTCCSILVKT